MKARAVCTGSVVQETGEHAVLFSQVAKITHHYCILTRIQPRATALQEGFGERTAPPSAMAEHALHPTFISRTLPLGPAKRTPSARVFLDWEGRKKSLSRVANISVAAGSSIYQTSFVSWNNEESFGSAEKSCHKLLFLLFPWRIKHGIVEISMISCSHLLERPVV